MHYNTIYDFKKICPTLCTIYIFPNNINVAKQKTIQRTFRTNTEKIRLLEIDEHYNKITSDACLKSQFDYFFYNNYDKYSEYAFINLVSKIMKGDK